MVLVHDGRHRTAELDVGDERGARGRVPRMSSISISLRRPGLERISAGTVILPTSWSKAAVSSISMRASSHPSPARDGGGQFSDPALMACGVRVAQLRRGAEGGHRGREGRPQLLGTGGDLRLGALLLAHVDDEAEEARRREAHGVDARREGGPVLAQEDTIAARVPGREKAGEMPPCPIARLRRHDVGDAQVHELFLRIAGQLGGCPVDLEVAAILVGDEDAIRGVVDVAAVARFTLAQRDFCPFALGDVVDDRRGWSLLPGYPWTAPSGRP